MSRLDPIDQDLLDFLCACVHHHCRVRTIKGPRRASLKRLRYMGLVGFDNFHPSVSAMRDWDSRHMPSLPSPGGTASEEPPRAKAADEGGGAVARKVSAPPMPTGQELYARLMAEAAKRRLNQTQVSRQVFGNPVQMTNMKAAADPVKAKTLAKAEAWIASGQNNQAAHGTAREAPVVEESTSAPSIEDGAATEEPQQSTTTAPAGAHPDTFRCGHPRTPENSQRVGVNRGPTCRTCHRERINRYRQEKAASRPFAPPATPDLDGAERTRRINARRGDAVRRSINRRAMERIEKGLPANMSAGAAVKYAQMALEKQMAEAARVTDPVEQAKRVLQRRYTPVCSMAVFDGPADLFMVGSRRNVTEAELLEMAERIAA